MSKFILALSLISIVPFWALADQDPIIVNYSYHNQIQGSVLTVATSGLVVITERTCCAPNIVMVTTKLSPDIMQNMIKLIAIAKTGQLIIQVGGPTSFGSLSGDFLSSDGTDQPIVIEKVERNPNIGQADKVTLNTSPAAKNIKDLVDALVTTKMPTLFFFSLQKQIIQNPAPTGQL